MHRHGGVAEHGFGPRRRHEMNSPVSRARPRRPCGYLKCQSWPLTSATARLRCRRPPSAASGPSSPGACPCRSAPRDKARRRPSATARDEPSSMVKRSRDQSQEAPRRLSWLTMAPPDSAFHAQTFSRNFSRPRSRRPGSLAAAKLALDHHLGGDAGMVGARLPQHVLAAHALEAARDVLQGVVEGMAHMQRAGDVGRRNDDRKGSRRGALGRSARKAPAASHSAAMRPSTAAGSKVFSIMS